MSQDLKKKKIAFIGLGKMGGILLRSMLERKVISGRNVMATEVDRGRKRELSRELGVPVTSDNGEAAANSEVIVLCLKPQVIGPVVSEIRDHLNSKKLLISIAASVPTRYIEELAGGKVPVIRVMPNTPCAVGSGMVGICKGTRAGRSHLAVAQGLFEATGRTAVVEEEQMDAVTGLSGSGPAFAYLMVEAMADGGVKAGLSKDQAILMAAQTVMGSARMVLETGEHPALLKASVTTPGGCTVDGLQALEDGGVRAALIRAVVRAAQRAGELLLKG